MNDVATETAPGPGHNLPPTPFDERKTRTESIIESANVWLAECDAISSDGQAGRARDLLELIRQASKANDEQRQFVTAPLRKEVDEINGRYKGLNALLGKASDAIKRLLLPWVTKLDAERQAKAKAEREEAERLTREAADRMAAAKTIEDQVAADEVAEAAKKTARAAERTSHERVGVKGEVAQSIGLRTQWKATAITNVDDAFAYYKTNADVHALLLRLASADARGGRRRIPGFKIEPIRLV